MSDTIFLHGLSVWATVGVHDWEQQAPRELLVDLDIGLDLSAAAASDALSDTLDYDAVATQVRALAASRRWNLIEHLGGCVADAVLADGRVGSVTVAVHKPGAVSGTRTLGIRLERSRTA